MALLYSLVPAEPAPANEAMDEISASRGEPLLHQPSVGPQIRAHSEWVEGALHLWLGMDGTAEQVQAQMLVLLQSLRQSLQQDGRRLSRVVCNGKVVLDAARGLHPAHGTTFTSVFDSQADAQSLPTPLISSMKDRP